MQHPLQPESPPLIIPHWAMPTPVQARQTTRIGGGSTGLYASLNLAYHVQDDESAVAHNRRRLIHDLPSEPVWLNQVHGVRVIDAATAKGLQDADASFTTQRGVVCVTMTADCLPILMCDAAGTVVAAIHAGWRSLCAGVVEQTVVAMTAASQLPASHLMAWLGPAIGPQAFEVGNEVRAQFIAQHAIASDAFDPMKDKWLANLYLIARQRLQRLGITQVTGGEYCTYTDQDTFYSYRRDGNTGRMASLIWIP